MIDARPPDMFDQVERDKALKRCIEVCWQAADASPDNLRLKLALADRRTRSAQSPSCRVGGRPTSGP